MLKVGGGGGGCRGRMVSVQREDHLRCLLRESGVRGGHRWAGSSRGGLASQGEKDQGKSLSFFQIRKRAVAFVSESLRLLWVFWLQLSHECPLPCIHTWPLGSSGTALGALSGACTLVSQFGPRSRNDIHAAALSCPFCFSADQGSRAREGSSQPGDVVTAGEVAGQQRGPREGHRKGEQSPPPDGDGD